MALSLGAARKKNSISMTISRIWFHLLLSKIIYVWVSKKHKIFFNTWIHHSLELLFMYLTKLAPISIPINLCCKAINHKWNVPPGSTISLLSMDIECCISWAMLMELLACLVLGNGLKIESSQLKNSGLLFYHQGRNY